MLPRVVAIGGVLLHHNLGWRGRISPSQQSLEGTRRQQLHCKAKCLLPSLRYAYKTPTSLTCPSVTCGLRPKRRSWPLPPPTPSYLKHGLSKVWSTHGTTAPSPQRIPRSALTTPFARRRLQQRCTWLKCRTPRTRQKGSKPPLTCGWSCQ